MPADETLIKVDGLSKKFCRDLKTSLRYGVMDVAREALGMANQNLNLRKKEFWSLQDINFELNRGETLGIVGANGAGKSTLLKILHGVLKPSRGRVEINGQMQALIELGGAFSPMLSGRENIYVSAAVLGIRKRDIEKRLDEIVEFAELQEFVDSPVATYSTGMKVRLGFSVAMFIEPEILILDEVLSVGDLSFQTKSLEKVAQIRQKAGGVVFVSHNINQLRRLCTKCLLLDHGKMLMLGDPDEVIDEYMRLQSEGAARGAGSPGLVSTGGIELLEWGITQHGQPAKGSIEQDAFRLWYRIRVDEPVEKVGLDVVLFNEAMQPVVDHTASLEALAGVSGEWLLQICYPKLPLAPRHYFPYIAVNDGVSLRKIIKFLDPMGFTVTGSQAGRGALDADLGIEAEKCPKGAVIPAGG